MPLLGVLSEAGLLLVLLSAPAVTDPCVAQTVTSQAPMELTTDTSAYCWYLVDRLHSSMQVDPAPPSHQVADLFAEGRHMCEIGQTRPGILRLRLGLMLITHKDNTPER